MKVAIAGNDANALVAAIVLVEEGHSVSLVATPDVSELTPGDPLSSEVATRLGLGASLEIVPRVGRSLSGESVTLKLRAIEGAVSDRDRQRWPEFVALLNGAADLWRGLSTRSEVVERWRGLGSRQAMEVLRTPWLGLNDLLNEWFESDLLKATLAAAALRGSRQGPFTPGSAFLLIQRWARGEIFGRSRVGKKELYDRATAAGVTIKESQFERFQVGVGQIEALLCDDGEALNADLYLTTLDPIVTLRDKVGFEHLDPETADLVESWDVRSTTTVVKLAPSDPSVAELVNLGSDLEALERAYDPTKYGNDSETPFGEFDARAGLLYLQHLTSQERAPSVAEEFCQRWDLGRVEKVWTPSGIEEEFGAAGGHLFGGERALWQSYRLRDRLANPLANLFVCGAATGSGDHGGGAGLLACQRLLG